MALSFYKLGIVLSLSAKSFIAMSAISCSLTFVYVLYKLCRIWDLDCFLGKYIHTFITVFSRRHFIEIRKSTEIELEKGRDKGFYREITLHSHQSQKIKSQFREFYFHFYKIREELE